MQRHILNAVVSPQRESELSHQSISLHTYNMHTDTHAHTQRYMRHAEMLGGLIYTHKKGQADVGLQAHANSNRCAVLYYGVTSRCDPHPCY